MASRTATGPDDFVQRLPGGRCTVVGAAFLAGWLLFALVWLADRRDAPAEAVPVKAAAEPEAFEPLPRPLPAGERVAPLPPAPADAPRLVEEAPPAQPPAAAEPAPLPPNLEAPPPEAGAGPAQPPSPIPEQSPSPEYPLEAMRRRESGTVMVEVEVDASGVPVQVELGLRSGSRDLDRAALQAVSRWRFQPARDAAGNAVPGRLSVPIDFKLE